jgi:hypothetical protein
MSASEGGERSAGAGDLPASAQAIADTRDPSAAPPL